MIPTTQSKSYQAQAYNPLTKEEKVQSAINRLDQNTRKAGLKSGKLNFLLDIDTNKTYKIKVGRFSAELKASSNLRLPNGSSESAGAHMIDLSTLNTKTIKSDEDLAKALKGRIVGFSVEEGSGRTAVKETATQARDAPTTDTSSSHVYNKANDQTGSNSRLTSEKFRASSQNDTSKIRSVLNRRTTKASPNSDKLNRLATEAKKAKATYEKNKALLKHRQYEFNKADDALTAAWSDEVDDVIAAASRVAGKAKEILDSQEKETNKSRKAMNTAQDAYSKERKNQREQYWHAKADSMRAKRQNAKTYLNNIKANISAKFSNAKKLVGSTIKSMTASTKSSAQNFAAGTARRGQAIWNNIKTFPTRAQSRLNPYTSNPLGLEQIRKNPTKRQALSLLEQIENHIIKHPNKLAPISVYEGELT